MKNKRQVFVYWLTDLYSGVYDESYYRRRFSIGQTHVRVGLPQHYMFMAMEFVWVALRQTVMEAPGVSNRDERLASLHKLLSLETAIMLESYKESYSSQIRQEERIVAEESLPARSTWRPSGSWRVAGA